MAERGETEAKPKRLRRAYGVHRRVVWTTEAGALVQAARIIAGISLRSLAEKAGCTRTMLNRIESGEVCPSPAMLQTIARILSLAWYQPPIIIGYSGVLRLVDSEVDVIAETTAREQRERAAKRKASRQIVAKATLCPSPAPVAPAPADDPAQVDPSHELHTHAIETESSAALLCPPTSTS